MCLHIVLSWLGVANQQLQVLKTLNQTSKPDDLEYYILYKFLISIPRQLNTNKAYLMIYLTGYNFIMFLLL